MHANTLKKTHEDVPPNFYDNALETNLIQRVWHTMRFRWIARLVSKVNGRILDIGCDGATLTEIVAAKSGTQDAVGIDISKDAVAYAKDKHPEYHLAVGHAEELPFRDGTFDMIFCSEVLEHVEQPARLLSEIKRCLKKDGYCVVEVPTETLLFKAIWSLWTRVGPGRSWRHAHVADFRGNLLDRLLKAAGFQVLQKSVFLGMLRAVKISHG